jgi:Domain of unknown function (DUF4145)
MSESSDWRFDYKQINATNWRQIDKAPKSWCMMTAVAKAEAEWITFFSNPKLEAKVPLEIAKLFEVSRGAMIYGWFFYPLLTLGVEQCYRLLDTGTRIRCNQLGIPTVIIKKNRDKRSSSFKENIDALMKRGFVSKIDEARWEAVRNLRNLSSHPERQSLYDPGQAQGTLVLVANFLNCLFA